MKRIAFIALVPLLLLAGCATAPKSAALTERQVCDLERMAQVEREAGRRQTHVVWVNCPKTTAPVS